jgi:hypothetical protein
MADSGITNRGVEHMQREAKTAVEYIVNHPLEIMAKYPRFRELLRNLADGFLLEIIQQENPMMRKKVEAGEIKRGKVFVDFAWDADAFDKWKKEEDTRYGIATSMMHELIPPNFEHMSDEERSKHFDENWDKITRAMDRIKRRTRYTGP